MLALLTFSALVGPGEVLDDPRLKGAMVCAIVTSLDGRVVFEKNADQRVMPASNEKLFTCAYALAQRGPDYTSETKFWFNKFEARISAYGDPTLPSETLVALRAKYKIGAGHRIYIKQAYRCDRPDTWQLGDAPNRYAPAVHAFSVDKAGFELHAGPKGISFEPHNPIIDKVVVEKTSSPLKFEFDPVGSSLHVFGSMPSSDTKIDTLSDPNPSQTAIACLTGTKNPITEVLDVDPKDAPSETLSSPPISVLIKNCLQPSDNCLAEHLLMIGSKASNYRDARKSITDWLRDVVGLDTAYFRCEDGSGLSRKNQTTVRSIAKLLKWTNEQKSTDLWRDSLAHSGEGTLAKRLKGIDFVGKTGSLDMVTALSGFVKCKDGETRIVSIILNHYGCSDGDAHDIMDRFVENVSK